MKRRTVLLSLGGGILLLAGCAAQTARAQASAPPRVFVSDLGQIPASQDGGPYVVLIPTHEETRPTQDLIEALESLGQTEARRQAADSTSHVAFLADPGGEFNASASANAIEALNARRQFGLAPSGGAVLVISSTDPTRETGTATAWVFDSNDPANIANSIRAALVEGDRHPGTTIQPSPGAEIWSTFSSAGCLILGLFPGAACKPSAPRP